MATERYTRERYASGVASRYPMVAPTRAFTLSPGPRGRWRARASGAISARVTSIGPGLAMYLGRFGAGGAGCDTVSPGCSCRLRCGVDGGVSAGGGFAAGAGAGAGAGVLAGACAVVVSACALLGVCAANGAGGATAAAAAELPGSSGG
jgi:hypothetical protein